MIIKKKHIVIPAVVAAAIAIVVWIVWGNTALITSEYLISSADIPDEFSGYRIAQVSDLHNAEFGENNEKLIQLLINVNPDIIVITGDLIDSRNTDIYAALKFIENAVGIAPVYYVVGNHEARVKEYEELELVMLKFGVTVLHNEEVAIEKNGQTIRLLGVDDPSFLQGAPRDEETAMETVLEELTDNAQEYTILLSHRPELFDIYVNYDIDLVFSGHAHGGQFRIPLIGGMVAPDQGLFPEYDAGVYKESDTTMIVSRGLGNSLFPFRINNRPELVIVTLQKSA